MHARKSLLFENDKPWCKKTNDNLFDVTMGSFDGAEICELVGLLILSKLKHEFHNNEIGLYRDDGLAAFKNMGPRTADNLRKRITKCFDSLGLKITIQANLKIADFLDVTFNLSNGSYYPYRKPSNPPAYINTQSNHPPLIIKQIPVSISKRISTLSCNAAEFNKAAPQYNEALRKSGFKEEIKYANDDPQPNPRRRQRKVIWFNPPFSGNVKTNVGRTFLALLVRHFPTSNPLHKIFNSHNTKVSYSCMGNMSSIIKQHNRKILNSDNETTVATNECNCRRSTECPLNGSCMKSNLVYQATVTTDQETKQYIGMTGNQFKTRYNNHTMSFKHRKHATKTALSKYIWDLKDNNRAYSIKWSIQRHANTCGINSDRCNLCTAEKLCILNADKRFLLNKRSELVSKCRHNNKFYVNNLKFEPHIM